MLRNFLGSSRRRLPHALGLLCVVSAANPGWESRDWVSGCIRASGWDLHSPCQGTALTCSDIAQGVLILSGVELISFPVTGAVLGFGMRIIVMK